MLRLSSFPIPPHFCLPASALAQAPRLRHEGAGRSYFMRARRGRQVAERFTRQCAYFLRVSPIWATGARRMRHATLDDARCYGFGLFEPHATFSRDIFSQPFHDFSPLAIFHIFDDTFDEYALIGWSPPAILQRQKICDDTRYLQVSRASATGRTEMLLGRAMAGQYAVAATTRGSIISTF